MGVNQEMDMDKLKQWLELAKSMHGGEFWGGIFDQEFARKFMEDEMFKNSFSQNENQGSQENPSTRTFPNIDLLESEEEVVVLVELPGVRKENIELGINGNVLTIKGKVDAIYPHLKVSYSEKFYGEFQRQVKLPDPIKPNEINAKFWNGILIVSYQRKMEKGEIIPID